MFGRKKSTISTKCVELPRPNTIRMPMATGTRSLLPTHVALGDTIISRDGIRHVLMNEAHTIIKIDYDDTYIKIFTGDIEMYFDTLKKLLLGECK